MKEEEMKNKCQNMFPKKKIFKEKYDILKIKKSTWKHVFLKNKHILRGPSLGLGIGSVSTVLFTLNFDTLIYVRTDNGGTYL